MPATTAQGELVPTCVVIQLPQPTLWHGRVEQLTTHDLGTTLLAAVCMHLLHTVKALAVGR